ncbi:hypothetical protein MUA04_24045 [Enterobacteriaceae bacterium H11S18]|uniref:structural cement protein Gp24 n=1 Tax=Dryocola clanedunensis TaxID=2925396 RepID=UPI0022F11681|nr:hypothetical protein [Dryocola clanedunensis]MCT4713244.1 hypothetical protein [Dryocola clanedunensis]
MTAILKRMPVGIAGAISRPQDLTVEPVILKASNLFLIYGTAGKYDDEGYFVPLEAGDTAEVIKGIYVRPYPTTSAPNRALVVGLDKNFPGDAMKRGYMTVQVHGDASLLRRGSPVYVLNAQDDTISVPIGGFVASAIDGLTVELPNAEFTGAGLNDGIAEISWKI